MFVGASAVQPFCLLCQFLCFFLTLLFLLLAKVQSGREECGGGKDLLIKLLLKYLLLCVNLYVLN